MRAKWYVWKILSNRSYYVWCTEISYFSSTKSLGVMFFIIQEQTYKLLFVLAGGVVLSRVWIIVLFHARLKPWSYNYFLLQRKFERTSSSIPLNMYSKILVRLYTLQNDFENESSYTERLVHATVPLFLTNKIPYKQTKTVEICSISKRTDIKEQEMRSGWHVLEI